MRRVMTAARSGFRRYPRAILESLRVPSAHSPRLRFAPDLSRHDFAAVWLGHGGLWLRLAGLNILVDPVFSDRIGIRIGSRTIGLPRLAPPPLHPHQLPRPDLVLITHAHFDHLDKPTLAALANPDTHVITARRTGRLVPRGFGGVTELDWDRSISLAGCTIDALRVAHWGARTALDRRRGYNSYVVSAGGRSVLLGGDTAHTDAFRGLGSLDLAALGIGAYDSWADAHATPEQVWEMFMESGARRLLPIHHSTFALGDEHPKEPMRRLLAAAGPQRHRVIRLAPGAVWSTPAR
ncbi:MAG: MBL fold metallo-hydrolase [Phycisphaerae bacterium]|nr:MBL fold metallo-hydrolase [Phycisphaerae bacterium]